MTLLMTIYRLAIDSLLTLLLTREDALVAKKMASLTSRDLHPSKYHDALAGSLIFCLVIYYAKIIEPLCVGT
jgi:hypothetical protein